MSEKKGFLSKLSNGISFKQRITLIITSGIIGAVVISALGFGGSDPIPLRPSGTATVGPIPSVSLIPKTLSGDELNVPKNSKIAIAIEKGRKNEIEETRSDKASPDSYMDRLKLENESFIKKKIEGSQSVKSTKRVKTGIDDVMKEKIAQIKAEKEQSDTSKIEIKVKKVQKIPAKKNSSPEKVKEKPEEVVTRAMLLDAFMREELSQYESDSFGLESGFSKVNDMIANVGSTNITYAVNNTESEEKNTGADGNNIEPYMDSLNNGGDEASSEPTNVYDIVPGQEMYAVIMNSINSDEPGPVLAKIVDGGVFDGAQLIGGFEANKESVTLTFNTLTVGNTVYDVAAVAVDLSDSGTTLADDVDKHVVERYGSLALASFVEGYANALTSTTVVTNADGSNTTSTGSTPNSGDQMKVALGTVGANFVPVLQENFERPTTIKVNGGRAIGILFLKPFNLNINN